MRTFAEKPKATQQATSAKASARTPPSFGHSNEVLDLQRTIGNQAVQPWLQTNLVWYGQGSTTARVT